MKKRNRVTVRPHTVYGRNGSKRRCASIEIISFKDQMIARLYHWYDMRIPAKVPGYRLLERVVRERLGGEVCIGFPGEPDPPRWRDRFVSWTFNQDMRCYQLSCTKQKVLGQCELSEEQYELLTEAKRPRIL